MLKGNDEHKYEFLSALPTMTNLYDIDMDEDSFIGIGMEAWEEIGNKNVKYYKLFRQEIVNYEVELPCNFHAVELVTHDVSYDDSYSHADISSTYDLNYYYNGSLYPNKIKEEPTNYIRGEIAKYEITGNTLRFQVEQGNVNIVYKGLEAGEDGLPMLTHAETRAIATYVAYIQMFKLALKKLADKDMVMFLKKEWQRMMANARVPEFINQNEMNYLLNVANSWDRKWYGKSYKASSRFS